MGRHQKQTVDWFPHRCKHGKTMFILEERYGLAGFAFWFKLLEYLGGTPGHYLDFNDEPTRQYLQSQTRQAGETTIEILDLLAKLDAIDKELWQNRIIWSQNFVDGLAPLYANRRQPLPQKPTCNIHVETPGMGISTCNLQGKTPKIGISTCRNQPETPNLQVKTPNSRVENSRVENSIEPLKGADALDACVSLKDYRAVMDSFPNKVGFLVNVFRRLHHDAPQEDFDDCGGRIADFWKRKSRDTGYILRVIWDAAAKDITGSHLNYIAGIINNTTGMTADEAREYLASRSEQ